MSSLAIQRGESHKVVVTRIWVSHLACLGVFFVPLTPQLLVAALIGYFVRVFAFEAGSHRYFSHRSFKTSRTFQFLLGALAAAAGQRGPIWWAVHHRNHHRHSDGPLDIHSPVSRSFWYAHMGWLLDRGTLDTDLRQAKDLARFPELVWLNKWHAMFPVGLLLITFAVGEYTSLFGRTGLGWSAVVWVFFVATVLGLHAAFSVNTLTHGRTVGWLNRRRYATRDSTTNSWLLAVPTLGASWHNNHHRYMGSARAGFYWWELDLSYLVLRALAALRLVWDLHPVPGAVLAEGRRPPLQAAA